MSRKGPAKRREILADPKFKDETVSKFINSLQQQGKRSIAEGIFYGALDLVETRTQEGGLETFRKALDNVRPVRRSTLAPRGAAARALLRALSSGGSAPDERLPWTLLCRGSS